MSKITKEAFYEYLRDIPLAGKRCTDCGCDMELCPSSGVWRSLMGWRWQCENCDRIEAPSLAHLGYHGKVSGSGTPASES
jgi:hypothetical protein